jgi:hypothetical protein
MDQTTQAMGWDSWTQAVLGNAVGAWVDREIRAPQRMYDSAQAYGMDANGNLFTLGQTNSQITANVVPTNGAGSFGSLLPWLLIGGVILFAVSGSK